MILVNIFVGIGLFIIIIVLILHILVLLTVILHLRSVTPPRIRMDSNLTVQARVLDLKCPILAEAVPVVVAEGVRPEDVPQEAAGQEVVRGAPRMVVHIIWASFLSSRRRFLLLQLLAQVLMMRGERLAGVAFLCKGRRSPSFPFGIV